jgi:protein translocase SecG subunit
MSTLYSILIVTSIVSALFLIIMVLMQQTSNSGLLSSSTSHFAPGSLDSFKNKLTGGLAVFFIGNIIMLWVVNNKMIANKNKASVVEVVAEKEKNVVPIDE